jgi:Domain of unknown function (DUF5655)/Domain of unknown function (DUF4287)
MVSSLDQALAKQLANIEKRTGKSLDELAKIIAASGLSKHGEIRDMLKRDLQMGHGDANTLVHHVRASAEAAANPSTPKSMDSVLDAIYAGPKSVLRPIHDKLMAAITKFGEFELAPKKTYISLRRKKQFAMIGPATNTRVEVGLNMKGVPVTPRLEAMPEKSMCQYKVKVTDPGQVDAELLGWIKLAFEATG